MRGPEPGTPVLHAAKAALTSKGVRRFPQCDADRRLAHAVSMRPGLPEPGSRRVYPLVTNLGAQENQDRVGGRTSVGISYGCSSCHNPFNINGIHNSTGFMVRIVVAILYSFPPLAPESHGSFSGARF